MTQYIDKSALVAEIEKKIKQYKDAFDNPSFASYEANLIAKGKYQKLKEILSFLNTLEVKEFNTWHLQKNEDIYDAVKDWSLHSFICLMDDGSIQKFTGIRSECADDSINTHIDAIDDKYDTNNIIFWIETPL